MVLIQRLLLASLLLFSQNLLAKNYTFKFATLIPPDTAWMQQIQAWADEVKEKSSGQLTFKIYPGGVMGDEPDVLRKIRSRQLQGAFFTGYGIGRIFSPARVLEIPFLFKNTDESDFVRANMMNDIETGFRQKGFELVGWPEVGFIHFFSKKPLASLDDIKTHRIWLWQGDPLGEALTKAAGITPVPLSIMDVYTQLSAKHGSIDTVYNSPFGALAMQWHSKLKYASNIAMTNAIGALVISQKFYKKLPPNLQQLLKQSGKKYADKINLISRRDNQQSIELLKQSGIEFMWNWNQHEKQQLLDIRDKAAAELIQSGYIPESYFSRTRTLLNQYRASHTDK